MQPVREWSMGRDEQIDWAKKHGIQVMQTKEKPYSYDENMWGNTGEGGEIENPELIPPLENILKWCNTPEKSPQESEILEIDFEQGVPVAINGKKKKLSGIIADCNRIGGKHGVGVFQLIEDRFVGLKVRGIYENPGAHILISAHKNSKCWSPQEKKTNSKVSSTKNGRTSVTPPSGMTQSCTTYRPTKILKTKK